MQSRRFALIFIIFVVLLALFAVEHRRGIVVRFRQFAFGAQPAAKAPVWVGRPLPSFQLTSLAGERAFIAPKPGHILYLNVFTTWCPDCVKEMPALETLRKTTATQLVDIVGIDQQESIQAVSRFASRFGLSYPVFLDDQHVTDDVLGIHYIPTTFIIDSHGVVRAHIAGVLSLSQMKQLVKSSLRDGSIANVKRT